MLSLCWQTYDLYVLDLHATIVYQLILQRLYMSGCIIMDDLIIQETLGAIICSLICLTKVDDLMYEVSGQSLIYLLVSL